MPLIGYARVVQKQLQLCTGRSKTNAAMHESFQKPLQLCTIRSKTTALMMVDRAISSNATFSLGLPCWTFGHCIMCMFRWSFPFLTNSIHFQMLSGLLKPEMLSGHFQMLSGHFQMPPALVARPRTWIGLLQLGGSRSEI